MFHVARVVRVSVVVVAAAPIAATVFAIFATQIIVTAALEESSRIEMWTWFMAALSILLLPLPRW